jgi:hypothetical protein
VLQEEREQITRKKGSAPLKLERREKYITLTQEKTKDKTQ